MRYKIAGGSFTAASCGSELMCDINIGAHPGAEVTVEVRAVIGGSVESEPATMKGNTSKD